MNTSEGRRFLETYFHLCVTVSISPMSYSLSFQLAPSPSLHGSHYPYSKWVLSSSTRRWTRRVQSRWPATHRVPRKRWRFAGVSCLGWSSFPCIESLFSGMMKQNITPRRFQVPHMNITKFVSRASISLYIANGQLNLALKKSSRLNRSCAPLQSR